MVLVPADGGCGAWTRPTPGAAECRKCSWGSGPVLRLSPAPSAVRRSGLQNAGAPDGHDLRGAGPLSLGRVRSLPAGPRARASTERRAASRPHRRRATPQSATRDRSYAVGPLGRWSVAITDLPPAELASLGRFGLQRGDASGSPSDRSGASRPHPAAEQIGGGASAFAGAWCLPIAGRSGSTRTPGPGTTLLRQHPDLEAELPGRPERSPESEPSPGRGAGSTRARTGGVRPAGR